MKRSFVIKVVNSRGDKVYLYFKELQKLVRQFNSLELAKKYNASIKLTGESEDYGYHAILKYRNFEISFIIYADLSWGSSLSNCNDYMRNAYYHAWNMWYAETSRSLRKR